MSEERDPPTPSLGNKRKRKRLQAETRVSRTGWVETLKSRQACVAGGRCHFHVVCFQKKMTLSTTWGSAVRSHSVEYIHWWHPACRGDHVSVAHRLRWGPHSIHDESMRTVYQTALPSRPMESSTWGALHAIHRHTSRTSMASKDSCDKFRGHRSYL